MQYFTEDYLNFFKDLAKNNNKEWFQSQRKRYEASVKKPLAIFVTDLISEVSKHEEINLLAKDCVSRINRDIRFSKDKTPYNLQMNAFVSKGGKKDKSIPGLYVRLGPEMLGIMGGSYGPEKHQLEAIRMDLMNNGDAFNKLISEQKFKSRFGVIQGEKMKRPCQKILKMQRKQIL